jgi:hypothetical protein
MLLKSNYRHGKRLSMTISRKNQLFNLPQIVGKYPQQP